MLHSLDAPGRTFFAAAARARVASSAARARSWSAMYSSYISPWLHEPEALAVGGGSVAVPRSTGGNTSVCARATKPCCASVPCSTWDCHAGLHTHARGT